MSNELTVLNNNTPSTGLDAFGDKVANIKIVQEMSRMPGKKPGYLYSDVSQEFYKELILLPLRASLGRTYFSPDAAFGGDKPECKSFDGIVPAKIIPNPPSPVCAPCRNAQWGRKANGKPIPPACPEEITFLAVSKETFEPVRFKTSGTGFIPAQNLIRTIRAKSKHPDFTEGGQPLELYDWFFTLSTYLVNSYYVPKFSELTRVATIGSFREVFLKYATSPSQEQTEEAAPTAGGAIQKAVENNIPV